MVTVEVYTIAMRRAQSESGPETGFYNSFRGWAQSENLYSGIETKILLFEKQK